MPKLVGVLLLALLVLVGAWFVYDAQRVERRIEAGRPQKPGIGVRIGEQRWTAKDLVDPAKLEAMVQAAKALEEGHAVVIEGPPAAHPEVMALLDLLLAEGVQAVQFGSPD